MYLSEYLSGILSNFNDSRTIRNVKNVCSKIIEHKSIQLWSISDDKAEFERSKRLIDGSLISVLDDKKISDALREHGTGCLGNENRVIVLYDPCDIRKAHSEKLENLGTVRSLDGELINGYSTFNSVGINEQGKKIYPIDISVYSNGDGHYVKGKELKRFSKGKLQDSDKQEDRKRAQEIQEYLEEDSDVNMRHIAFEQMRRVSKDFKKINPDVTICKVLDRQFDGDDYFLFIDETLEDEFVIRMKISRNSNEFEINPETGKKEYIKLKDVKLATKEIFYIDKLSIKKKVYQQVKLVIEYDKLTIKEKDFTVVRVTLLDRTGKMIFDNPMLLITNIPVKSKDQARAVYRTYLMRSKIEGVFKFLKSVLGWEQFQIEDYESIKNIIALCYFIGAYFYEIESELTNNQTIQAICLLGAGKGKVTRYFFLQGLKKILVHKSVKRFVKKQNITHEIWEDMLRFVDLN